MMSTDDTTTAAPAPVAIPSSLTGTLRALARRDLLVAWFSGAGRIATLFLGLGVVRCLFDYWVQLDWAVRAVFLVIDFAIAGWLVWRHGWKPWKRRLGLQTAALRLERVFPVLQSRVIAAVQLPRQVEREAISRELVAVVVKDAAATLARLRWRDAAPARPAIRWLRFALVCAVIGGGLFALQPRTASVLARRWLLSHEPAVTRTKLTLSQQDLKLPLGSTVSLGAITAGSIPKKAVFEVAPATGDTRTFPVEAAAGVAGSFILKIDNVQQSFRYRVRAGDARSEWHDVTTLPAPSLLDPRFTIEPPLYTGLTSSRSDGEVLVVPAGSTIRVDGRSSLALTAAHAALWDDLKSVKPSATSALKLSASSASFSGAIVVNKPAGALTIPLTAVNGLVSQADTRLPVRYIPDAAPVVELTAAPADNELATVNSGFRIRGRSADDYGISRITFCWEIAGKDKDARPAAGRRKLPLPANPGRRADFAVAVSTGAAPADAPAAIPLTVAAGDTVSWWIESADNAPAPSVTSTPRRSIRIVTPDEKLSEMMARLREGMGELDDVSRRQEQIGDALGRLLPDASPKK
ncbi:MAG: DUF4175 family protein [Opitutaceae bacterium]|jgi:hypothetical protein